MNVYHGIQSAPEWAERAHSLFGDTPGYYKQVDPVSPDRWLREFDVARAATRNEMSPWEVVRTSEEHLMILENECNLAVPRREYCLTAPDGISSEPRLFMSVQTVRGVELENAPVAVHEKPLRHLAQGVRKYLDWVRDTAQEVALMDMADSRQYMYGRAGYTLDKQVYLVDVEPHLISPVDSPLTWMMQLQEFQRWTSAVGMTDIGRVAVTS